MKEMEKEIVEVALDDIIPNRFQPRLAFDEQSLNELAKSIRQHGIIQPLVLRKVGNKFEIIAGERRYKASYIAGLTKVPAIVIDLDDNESAEVAIVENLQRQDLSPIEEAKSYKKLLDRGYLTQDQLATRMGKTQATISNKMRLLNLDESVQKALLDNKISERHARSLLRLEQKDQAEMLDRIINNRLNVKATEEAITSKLNGTEIPSTNILNKNEEITNLDNLNSISNFNSNIEEKEISKDRFINPSLVKEVNEEEKINEAPIDKNPIPFIRPVLDDDLSNVKKDNIGEQPISSNSNFDILNNRLETVNQAEKIIKDAVDNLKKLGFEVKLEQYDFENLYQYVIKVDKN